MCHKNCVVSTKEWRRVISATIVTMYVVDLIHGADFQSISNTTDPRTVLQPLSQHFLPERVPTTSKSHMGFEIDALSHCKTLLVLVIQIYSFCAGNRESKSCQYVEQSRQTEAALWAHFAPSPSPERTAVRRGNKKGRLSSNRR